MILAHALGAEEGQVPRAVSDVQQPADAVEAGLVAETGHRLRVQAPESGRPDVVDAEAQCRGEPANLRPLTLDTGVRCRPDQDARLEFGAELRLEVLGREKRAGIGLRSAASSSARAGLAAGVPPVGAASDAPPVVGWPAPAQPNARRPIAARKAIAVRITMTPLVRFDSLPRRRVSRAEQLHVRRTGGR